MENQREVNSSIVASTQEMNLLKYADKKDP